MTNTVVLEEAQIAIVLTPLPEGQVRFQLFRCEDSAEEPSEALYLSTGVALGMVGVAINAPDLVAYMSDKFSDEEIETPPAPALKLVTLEGEHVDREPHTRVHSNDAKSDDKPSSPGAGGYTRDLANSQEDPPDDVA